MAKARNSFTALPKKLLSLSPSNLFQHIPKKSLSLIQCEGKLQEKEMRFCFDDQFCISKNPSENALPVSFIETIPDTESESKYRIESCCLWIYFATKEQVKLFHQSLQNPSIKSFLEIIKILKSLNIRPELIISFFTNYFRGFAQIIDNQYKFKAEINLDLPIEAIPPTSRKFSVKISVGNDPTKLVYHSLPNETDPIVLRDIQIGSYFSQITFNTTEQITKFETALSQGTEGVREAYEVLEELHTQSATNCTHLLLEHLNTSFLNIPEIKSSRLTSS